MEKERESRWALSEVRRQDEFMSVWIGFRCPTLGRRAILITQEE